MRAGLLLSAAEHPTEIFGQYESFKRDFKDTDNLCKAQGIDFVPLVVEAHSGAWSPTMHRPLQGVAAGQAAAAAEHDSVASLRIAQRTSIALYRANARAVLRRLPPSEADPPPTSGWDLVEIDTFQPLEDDDMGAARRRG